MNQTPTLLEQLKSNFVLIVCIAGIISTWTLFGARLTGAEEDITDLQKVVADISEIKTEIAVIQIQLAEQAKKDTTTVNKIDSASGKLDYIIEAVNDSKKR